jgi:hypothetical protein
MLDVTSHPQIRLLQHEFTSKMDTCSVSLKHCPTCKERYYGKSFSRSSPNACTKCEDFFKKHGFYERTGYNDMDPFPRGYPFHLPEATPMKEAMCSRVFVVMKSYYLSNGSLGYRGSVLNLEQDISNIVIAAALPWLPEELPVWIVRKHRQDLPDGYKDLRFNARS